MCMDIEIKRCLCPDVYYATGCPRGAHPQDLEDQPPAAGRYRGLLRPPARMSRQCSELGTANKDPYSVQQARLCFFPLLIKLDHSCRAQLPLTF